MKKAFKTIFIYLGVLILAFIATVVFCAAFLFFYRDGNIFGIQYVKNNQIIYARENEDMADIEKIEISGDNFDINIKINGATESIAGAMRNKTFGYVKKSKAQANFGLEYNENTKTAVFAVQEPKGWLSRKESYIEIAVPSTLVDAGIKLSVNTNKGDVTIGGDTDWALEDIDINVAKGDVTFTNLKIEDNMNISIGSGTFYVDEKCETDDSATANINLGSGTINLSKINTELFNLSTVKIESIKRGKIGILEAGELITDKNINGGGTIEIKDVGFVDFASLDTNIKINQIINSTASSRIEITGNGEVLVNHTNGHLEVYGHNGDINIKVAERTLTVCSNQGDITVSQAIGQVSAETQYGTVNVAFDDTVLDYDTTNKYRSIIAVTKNGHIYATGVQNVYITATDKGRVSLKYDKVAGENVINSNSGAVNIVVPNPQSTTASSAHAFNLKVSSEINTDIKVGAAGSLGKVDTDTRADVFNNIYGNAGSNNLSITTKTGPIKIRSADLIGY